MTGLDFNRSYLHDRESELKRMGKGVLWYMVPRGSGLIATASKDVMVIAIMREEAKRRLEKHRGEVGGGWWYVACLMTRAFQLQARLPALRRECSGLLMQRG